MLDDGSGVHISEPHAGQAEAFDHGAEYRRQHFLVADRRIRGMRPRERNAQAADDGDAPHSCADEHWTSSGRASPEAREGAPDPPTLPLLGPSWASALQARRSASSKIAPGDFVLAHPGPRPCRPGALRRPKSLQAILCWPILGLGLAGPALCVVQNRSRRFCAGPSWASAFTSPSRLAGPRPPAVSCSTRLRHPKDLPPWATSPPSWPATAMSFRPTLPLRRAAP